MIMAASNIIFSGTANPRLARNIARISKSKFGRIYLEKFSDSEIYVNIKENIKNKDCFIFQSCSNPTNENLMELLIIIDAAKRLKPKKITAVLPFYAYRRQERKIEKGESVTAALVAKLIEAAGADQAILVELHSTKIESFFKIPTTNVRTLPIFHRYFKNKLKRLKDYVVVSPDRGAKEQSLALAQALKIGHVLITKSRPSHEKVKIEKITGHVADKNIIMLDDEINTAGTICKVSYALKNLGAKNIFVAATHGIFSKDALANIALSPIKEVVVTDTISLKKKTKKIKTISVANLISKTLKNKH